MDLILETRYLPEEEIGRGGFGKTFRAWDAHFQRYCVVKQLQPRNTSGNPFSPSELKSIEKLFKREAETLRDLSHEQIPQLYDYFQLPTPSNPQQELFYLVQQYIQGQTLAQELNIRSRFIEDEVVRDLRQILNVLNYIHEATRRVIHRDIKPSNIIRDQNGKLYLIDFGAVKRALEPGVLVEQSMAIGTPIFAPPEQLSGGKISPCSDLYSLAVTCVCLLTGRSANELKNQNRWIWKEYVNVNDNLAGILDRMLLPNPVDRFQSVGEVIAALSGKPLSQIATVLEDPSDRLNSIPLTLPPNRRNRRMLKVLALIILGLVASAIAFLIHWLTHPPICDFQNQDGFSCGEQILIPQNPKITNTIFADKQRGADAFGQGDFKQAKEYFQRYLMANKNDPEARIYLNNSRAALTNNPLKIAASVPIIDDPLNSSNALAEQMLRGLAHVQDHINQNKGINGRLLFIEIASYLGQKEKIKRIADAIALQENILGVIGYYTSESTIETASSFDGKMVVISPTSAAVRDSNFPLFSKYVFRATPDNSAVAGKLVEYMRHQKRKKTAIFYEPNEKYTISFMKEFKNVLFQNQGEVVNECQVTQTLSEALNCLQQAKQSNAEVILLALSQKVADNVIIAIINQSENITILGGAPLYSESVSQANIPVDKLRSIIPWHRSNGTKSKFELESAKLWGTGDVNWRTAMSYDATMAMVEGLRRSKGNYTRQQLYKELKNPAFSAEGATAKVQFDEKGDRKPLPGIGVLVKVENNRFVIDEQSQQ